MNRFLKQISALTLFCIAFSLSSQAQIQLQASWDTAGHNLGQSTTIVIGDQVDVILSLPDVGTTPVNFPTMDAFQQNGIVPIAQRRDTIQGSTQRLITTITCFDEGTHALGGLAAQYMDDNHTMQQVSFTDSLYLTVNDYPNVDTASLEIKDIAGILREPYTFWEIFRWILLALVVCGVAWGIYYIVKNKKKTEPAAILKPKAPSITPKQKALQELEQLRLQRLWQSGKIKEYYTQLTDIVRLYLKERYRIDSTEMTSDQTLDAFIRCTGYSSERENLLSNLLRTADMVKFAKAEPPAYEHDRAFSDATAFIELEKEPIATPHSEDNNSKEQPKNDIPYAEFLKNTEKND